MSNRTTYVPFEKSVKEIKAPTDESIRILNEFQEKARANIIANVPIETNLLKGVIVVFQNDLPSMAIDFYAKFNLNGEEVEIHEKVKHSEVKEFIYSQWIDADNTQQMAIIKYVIKVFSEKVSEYIVKSCATDILKAFKDGR